MPMLSTWLPRAGRLAAVLAPVALLAGLWIRVSDHLPGALRITIDREQALERAREEALRLGFTPAPGGAIKVRGDRRRQSEIYSGRGRENHSVWPPPYTIRVALRLQEEDGGWTADLAADGSLLGFEADVSDRAATQEAAARSLAQQELRAWLARNPGWKAGEIRNESGGADSELRLSWKLESPERPGETGKAEALVRGRRLVRFGALLDSAAQSEKFSAFGAGALTAFAGLVIAISAVYSIRLFLRRKREEEIPRERAVILVALFCALGLMAAVFNLDAAGEGEAPRDLTYWVAVLVAALAALFSFLGGLLLAAAYSGTDGEVREGYPGKMLSFDALLSGQWSCRAVGRSVIVGAAWASWALLGFALLMSPVSPWFAVTYPEKIVSLALGRLPAAALAARAGLHITWIAIAGLFVPLAFVHRNVRTPWRRIATLLIVPFLLASSFEDKPPALWPLVASGLAGAAALTLPFLAVDLLAAVSSFGFFTFFSQMTSLWPLVASWTPSGAWLLGGVLLAALVFAIVALRGNTVNAVEVLPAYVSNLERRLTLRAEVNAARQAQLRLLPQKPPRVPGLTFAGVCLPSSEVGGDFYDFTAVGDTQLAVFVASGGRSPVASALAIALAKGFLACDLVHAEGPGDSLTRLSGLLRRTLGETSDHLDLTLALVRPSTGETRIARTNERPGVWVLSGVRGNRPAPEALQLEPGESLLFHTPGLLRLLDDQSATGIADWFGRLARLTAGEPAPRILESVLDRAGGRKRKNLSAARLRADVTAVVITREAP